MLPVFFTSVPYLSIQPSSPKKYAIELQFGLKKGLIVQKKNSRIKLIFFQNLNITIHNDIIGDLLPLKVFLFFFLFI